MAEVVSGQIHLKAQRDSSVNESSSLFVKAVAIPDKFAVEYRILFKRLGPTGVAVPGDAPKDQPTGSCARLDVLKFGRGALRVDIFTDKMVSFWTRNAATKDYPTTSFLNVTTQLNRWYTFRFEGNFLNPERKVQVYRDNIFVGILKLDPRNPAGADKLRPMAYARKIGGAAEVYIDSIQAGTKTSGLYPMGTYTSEVMDLGAAAFGKLSWTEEKVMNPWGAWTKYAGNPVLDDLQANGNMIENILSDINNPLLQPILYPHPTLGNKYWLVYATCCGGNIRAAYSSDLLHWTAYEHNPILSPSPGEIALSSPNLFKDGGTYYLFYDVAAGSAHGLTQRVTYATAPTPLGPWKKGPIILDLGAPGEWDGGRVTEPFVFKDGETYYLFYMGDNLPPYCDTEQIGLATTPASRFPKGPWTKHGVILPNIPDWNAWDRGLTADPSVIKVKDTFYMLYTGSYADAYWKLGIAWSKSPFGPWNRAPAPTIYPGPDSWESEKVIRGAIHYHEGKFYMPYGGFDGGRFRGGMATAPADPRFFEALIDFETRTSADGTDWEDWKPLLNDSTIQSTPNRYFQFKATLHFGSAQNSPVLTGVTIEYDN